MDNLICILKLKTQRISKDNYKTKYEAISYNGLKKDNPMFLVKYFESLITFEWFYFKIFKIWIIIYDYNVKNKLKIIYNFYKILLKYLTIKVKNNYLIILLAIKYIMGCGSSNF